MNAGARALPDGGTEVDGFVGLDYTQRELQAVMRAAYDDLIAFVRSEPFRESMAEMAALAPEDRPQFVLDVFTNPEERQRRGFIVPEGVLIQRSAFGDRRPTLFCVKKFLPEKYRDVWENANLTFDNEFEDHDVSRHVGKAWREPLDVSEQAALMASGKSLEEV